MPLASAHEHIGRIRLAKLRKAWCAKRDEPKRREAEIQERVDGVMRHPDNWFAVRSGQLTREYVESYLRRELGYP